MLKEPQQIIFLNFMYQTVGERQPKICLYPFHVSDMGGQGRGQGKKDERGKKCKHFCFPPPLFLGLFTQETGA